MRGIQRSKCPARLAALHVSMRDRSPSARERLGKIMATKLPTIAQGSLGLSRYLEEIRKFPMLEPGEEFMLAKRWQEHADQDAAEKLVTSHLRLVARIAMGYRGYGLPIGEVISEGNVGLMQAVKRFDPDKGFRLATYAMWWIRASIQEYILRSWSLVKMGTTAAQKKLFFNLRRAKSQLQALDEGDLRPEQVKTIARKFGVSRERRRVDEPAARRRRLAQCAGARRRRGRRVAGLAGRRRAEPGRHARRDAGARPAQELPVERARPRSTIASGASSRRAASTDSRRRWRICRPSSACRASASARSRCAPSRRCRRRCRCRRARRRRRASLH